MVSVPSFGSVLVQQTTRIRGYMALVCFSTLFRVSAGATGELLLINGGFCHVSVPSFGSVLVQPHLDGLPDHLLPVSVPSFGSVLVQQNPAAATGTETTKFQYPLSGQCWCNSGAVALGDALKVSFQYPLSGQCWCNAVNRQIIPALPLFQYPLSGQCWCNTRYR